MVSEKLDIPSTSGVGAPLRSKSIFAKVPPPGSQLEATPPELHCFSGSNTSNTRFFFADVRYESSGKWCNNLIFIFFQDFSWLFHHHGSFHPTLLVVIVISCELISHWANAWQSAETPDRPIVIKWPRTISNGFGIDQETELVSNRSNSTVYDYII